jgi:hypothetical protein
MVEWLGYKDHHSSRSSVKVQMGGAVSPLPHTPCMIWCFIKHSSSFLLFLFFAILTFSTNKLAGQANADTDHSPLFYAWHTVAVCTWKHHIRLSLQTNTTFIEFLASATVAACCTVYFLQQHASCQRSPVHHCRWRGVPCATSWCFTAGEIQSVCWMQTLLCSC